MTQSKTTTLPRHDRENEQRAIRTAAIGFAAVGIVAALIAALALYAVVS